MAEKPLTSKQLMAAALCAADELTNAKIAQQVGIGERTLDRWLTDPQFLDAIDEHNKRIQAAMLKLDIAKRHKRVAVQNDLHERMLELIEARASQYAAIPGGVTGLIVRQRKATAEGIIEEYVFDRALVSEIRSTHERVSKELGQEIERSESKSSTTVTIVGLDPDAL